MVLNKLKIEKILKKLSSIDISIEINPNKKKKRVYSVSDLFRHSISFDGPLDLNEIELKGIIAHELGHIEKNHIFILHCFIILLSLSWTLIGIIVLYLNVSVNWYCFLTLFVIFLLTLLIIYGRNAERSADIFAKNKVGKKPIIKGLEKIKKWGIEGDIIHGNTISRIKRLEKS